MSTNSMLFLLFSQLLLPLLLLVDVDSFQPLPNVKSTKEFGLTIKDTKIPNRKQLKSTSTPEEDTENDFLSSLKNFFNFSTKLDSSSTVETASPSSVEMNRVLNEKIANAKEVLNRAAETKAEDPELVLTALTDLEKLMREKCKNDGSAAEEVLENLSGDWRLIFTTGTGKFKDKINYFPIKAVQSFDATTTPKRIENGIYLGDFNALKFKGDFEFDLTRRKLEFDFDQIVVLGFTINLAKGKAAELGAASGLGSENNVQLVEKNKKPFFNWISADETIATARGGGGGLALWKRVALQESTLT